MADNFQSQPKPKKPPKDAKTVVVKGKPDSKDDVVASATINEEALRFIRAYKKSRPKQE
jgi:hypothetical protein